MTTDTRFLGQAHIRPAVSGDADRLGELAIAAYERYLQRMDRKPAPMTEDYAQRIAEGSVFVLEVCSSEHCPAMQDVEPHAHFFASPAIAGFIVLFSEKDALLLDNVAVDPSAQGRGYGKMLMAFAEEHARTKGFCQILLYTNEIMTENLSLYPRLGYTETHRAREKGFNRVFFSKAL